MIKNDSSTEEAVFFMRWEYPRSAESVHRPMPFFLQCASIPLSRISCFQNLRVPVQNPSSFHHGFHQPQSRSWKKERILFERHRIPFGPARRQPLSKLSQWRLYLQPLSYPDPIHKTPVFYDMPKSIHKYNNFHAFPQTSY